MAMAMAAVQKIDAAFAAERAISGRPAHERLTLRRSDVAPLIDDLIAWMRSERAGLSRHNEVAKAMDYMLRRIEAFTQLLADGRICLSNNAAERALRGIALGRKAWLFAGSDRGGERAAVMFTLIQTAKLNGVDPRAWLADVLARIADQNSRRLDQLLPWN
jgi:transposase